MPEGSVDLTFIDPHRRDLVRRRIAAVEDFIGNDSDTSAEALAKRIGLTTASFYNLVKAWQATRDPARMQGAGQETRSPGVSEELMRLITSVNTQLEEKTVSAVVKEVINQAECANVELQPRNTIRAAVDRLRVGTARNLPEGVTHVIDHCDLNVPIKTVSGTAAKATFSALVRVNDPGIVAWALYLGVPKATALEAIPRSARTAALASLQQATVLVDAPRTQGWDHVRSSLCQAGSTVVGEVLDERAFEGDKGALRKRGNGRTLFALLGRYIAGYTLHVRNGSMKPAKLKAGAIPLELADARELIAARLEDQG